MFYLLYKHQRNTKPFRDFLCNHSNGIFFFKSEDNKHYIEVKKCQFRNKVPKDRGLKCITFVVSSILEINSPQGLVYSKNGMCNI